MTDAESTSAALRRVETELQASVTLLMEAWAARDQWELKHNLARAELVSARTELDAVRTVRDNLDRELADAYNTIRALVGLPITRRTEESETT